MKRTKNKIIRTNYIPLSVESNLKKINILLTKMAMANNLKNKKLFNTLDKELFKAQQLQLKLKNK